MRSRRSRPAPTRLAAETAVLTQLPYDHPDAARLVRALFDEQVGRYGFADPIAADPADYAPPRGLFLVAYTNGTPCACGGYRPYGPRTDTAEIKKLYTVPGLRGQGVGALILTRLEAHAAARGARSAILETGVRNDAALLLFKSAGYRPTPQYVTGRDPAINRAFLKDLPGPDSPPSQKNGRTMPR